MSEVGTPAVEVRVNGLYRFSQDISVLTPGIKVLVKEDTVHLNARWLPRSRRATIHRRDVERVIFWPGSGTIRSGQQPGSGFVLFETPAGCTLRWALQATALRDALNDAGWPVQCVKVDIRKSPICR